MLDLYNKKGSSILQKSIITAFEILLIYLSYYIMFDEGASWLALNFEFTIPDYIPTRRYVILIFSTIILLRMAFMMFYLMKRTIPWSETLSVPGAFTIYYVGFALLVLPNGAALGAWDWFAIALFILGCYLNTASEYQRHIFKLNPANKGKLYMQGLFKHSMHINYFGDIVWVTAYAIIAGSFWGVGIIIMLTSFFAYTNIPLLDKYLENRYPEFTDYEAKTKKLIPYIW